MESEVRLQITFTEILSIEKEHDFLSHFKTPNMRDVHFEFLFFLISLSPQRRLLRL